MVANSRTASPTCTTTRRRPSLASDGGAHVAVVEQLAVVVGGDQDRAAGVPLLVVGDPGALGHQPLDQAVPAADAVGTLAVGAQQAVPVDSAASGRPASPASAATRSSIATSTTRARNAVIAASSSGSTSSPRRTRRAATAHRRVGVAVAQRLGQGSDVLTEAVRWSAGRRPASRTDLSNPATRSASTAPGLDRGELVGVADQHQPGVGADRLEQPRHHRQRHHRGLVDHDHVVGQPVGRGRAGTGRGCRVASRAAGAGSRRAGRRAALVGRVLEGAVVGVDRLLHRFLEPRGRLAGRRGQRDARRSAGGELGAAPATSASRPATVVVLPVPGPPVSTVVHRDAAARAASRCSAYPSPGKTRSSPASRAAASTSGGVRRIRATQVVADLPLLAPVAVEVEAACRPGAPSPRAPAGCGRPRSTQAAGFRPRQRCLVPRAGGRRRRQVEADRARAYGANGQRGGEQHLLVGLVEQRTEP